jgi:pyruvate/2-oxoglutarate dehydrogenase complex dihydrolipoamide dehydrogenase (E3) component
VEPKNFVLRAQATGEGVVENDERPAKSLAVVQMAMTAGVTYGKLAHAIFAHPTTVEGLRMFQMITPGKIA